MNRRVRWLAIVALLLLLALPGTGVGQEGPVKIGVLTPLSPPGDPAAGQLISRGAALGAAYVTP